MCHLKIATKERQLQSKRKYFCSTLYFNYGIKLSIAAFVYSLALYTASLEMVAFTGSSSQALYLGNDPWYLTDTLLKRQTVLPRPDSCQTNSLSVWYFELHEAQVPLRIFYHLQRSFHFIDLHLSFESSSCYAQVLGVWFFVDDLKMQILDPDCLRKRLLLEVVCCRSAERLWVYQKRTCYSELVTGIWDCIFCPV